MSETSFMQIIMLAADEDFSSDLNEWAEEIRAIDDSEEKEAAVEEFFEKFPSDKRDSFMGAAMLVLKGSGTPGAAEWMEKLENGEDVTIEDLVEELTE